MPDLEPVMVGGYVVAYRPKESAPKKTSAKPAAKKKTAAKAASTAEEATK